VQLRAVDVEETPAGADAEGWLGAVMEQGNAAPATAKQVPNYSADGCTVGD